MRHASSLLSASSTSVPAISRASASTSSDKARAEWIDKLKPWRSAFLAARARARAVFGPVLAREFARFALILRSLVMPRFLLPVSYRGLRIRPRFLAFGAGALHRGLHDADRSREACHCGDFRRWRSGDRIAQYCSDRVATLEL